MFVVMHKEFLVSGDTVLKTRAQANAFARHFARTNSVTVKVMVLEDAIVVNEAAIAATEEIIGAEWCPDENVFMPVFSN